MVITMKVVIAGGGKIGYNLAKLMLEKRHYVSLIESDREKCAQLANDLDAEIICGDCTTVRALEAARTEDCECFMAVTGIDQDNLVAGQLAKNYFRAKKVIARSSNPRNIETFKLLGIDYTVSSTDIITKIIEQEASMAHMHLLASLNKGKAGVISTILPENTAYDNMKVMDIKFPKGTLVISVVREGELIIPNGSTVLKKGDEIVAVCVDKYTKALSKLVSETKKL